MPHPAQDPTRHVQRTSAAPKALIICCDGTWNSPVQTDRGRLAPTNVVRLARALEDDFGRPKSTAHQVASGMEQKIYYDQGVGTGNFEDQVVKGFPASGLRNTVRSVYQWARRWDQGTGVVRFPLVPRLMMRLCFRLDSWVGGITGAGLVENVYDSYQFLVDNYDPGDKIYLFGFSRGAYTVRSLAGLIHKCGLVCRETCEHWLRETERHCLRPQTCHEAGRKPCGACVTNRARIDEVHTAYQRNKEEDRRNHAAHTDTQEAAEALQELSQRYTYTDDVKINMIGVWDTVGAMGVPRSASLFRGIRRHRDHYQFLNTSINDSVEYAYQALALDERRLIFRPTVWDARPPYSSEEPRVHQVWFAGVHSNVGGGYDDAGLSDISLGWMMHWAEKRGLRFQKPYQGRLFPDYFGEVRNPIEGFLNNIAYKAAPRFPWPDTYPDGLPKIHYTVFDKRRRGISSYQPCLPPDWQENEHYTICTDGWAGPGTPAGGGQDAPRL